MWPLRSSSLPPARRADPVVDQVLDALREHPIATEATRQAFERRQDQRRHHAAEIERLRAEEAAQLAAAQVELDAAEAALQHARETVRAAERRAREAHSAKQALSLAGPCGMAISRHANALRELTEPEIEAFLSEMKDLAAADRASEITSQSMISGVDLLTMRRNVVELTNRPSANARTQAIHDAIATATAMRDVADQEGIGASLEALRRGIPKIASETIVTAGGAAGAKERGARRAVRGHDGTVTVSYRQG